MHGRISNDSKALCSQLSCAINGAELQRNGGFHSEIGFIRGKSDSFDDNLVHVCCTSAGMEEVYPHFNAI